MRCAYSEYILAPAERCIAAVCASVDTHTELRSVADTACLYIYALFPFQLRELHDGLVETHGQLQMQFDAVNAEKV